MTPVRRSARERQSVNYSDHTPPNPLKRHKAQPEPTKKVTNRQPEPTKKVTNRQPEPTKKVPTRQPESAKKLASRRPESARQTTQQHPREEPIKVALQRLHSSSVPQRLPCRDDQFADIFKFVEQKLKENEGGCMYISGVPGTGKTATLYEVKRKLLQTKDLPRFKFVEINGLRIGHPNQFYVHLLMELTGKKDTNFQAINILNNRFTDGKANKEFVVLFVDELDLLRTKKQDILYHLFDWPNHQNSKLIVLAIANAMDLPERFLFNRVASRLGLTRLLFQPYHFRDLETIVRARLLGPKEKDVFDSDALQLICRKVAAVSGDARRVLDICRRSLEITIAARRAQVTMGDVDKALNEIFNSIKLTRIRKATRQEQVFLQSIVQAFRTTGIEESRFIDIYESHVSRCRLEDFPIPTTTELTKIATNLDSSKLILFEKSPSHLYRRIRLNVSVDDINFALSSNSA